MHRTSLAIALSLSAGPVIAQQYRLEFARDPLAQAPYEDVRAPAVGDLDGDGVADLVATGPRIWFRRGGRFEEQDALAATLPASFGAPLLADTNGDGDLDLIYLSSLGLTQLHGDGAGGFVPAPAIPVTFSFDIIVASDIDGDGDRDLVTSAGEVLVNDGTGVFSNETATRVTGSPGFQLGLLAVVDVDGDLDDDVVLLDGLYDNDGSGNFTHDPGSGLALSYGDRLFVTDIDADGDSDLITADDEVFLNDGFGVFGLGAPLLPPALQNAWQLGGVGDFDGDGDVDVVRVQDYVQVGTTPVLMRNVGGAFPAAMATPIPVAMSRTHWLVPADLTGDGDLDMVFAATDAPLELVLNDGAGGFTSASAVGGHDQPRTYARLVLDADGDGDQDYVSIHSLHRNDGRGTFTREIHSFAGVLAGADFDGDGAMDVLGYDRVAFNDGAGTFVAGPPLAGLPTFPQAQAAAAIDIEGDGDNDIAVLALALGGNRTLIVFENDGAGGFSIRSSTTGMPGIGRGGLIARDFDDDGDPDLFLAGVTTNSFGDCRLLLNDGVGNFTPAPLPLSPAYSTNGVAGDFEGDGDVDVLVHGSGFATLFLNDGSAGFTTLGLGFSTPTARADDVDGDGDLDLWTRTGPNGAPELLINDGSNGFAVDPIRVDPRLPPHRGVDVLLLDAEGDGDRDVLFVIENIHTLRQYSKLYWNHRRQLRAPAMVEVGGVAELELDAESGTPPASAALLAYSLAEDHVPYGALGTVGIDLTTAVAKFLLLPPGITIDTVPIPNDPALAGLPLFAQAVFFGDGAPRLSGTVSISVLP